MISVAFYSNTLCLVHLVIRRDTVVNRESPTCDRVHYKRTKIAFDWLGFWPHERSISLFARVPLVIRDSAFTPLKFPFAMESELKKNIDVVFNVTSVLHGEFVYQTWTSFCMSNM